MMKRLVLVDGYNLIKNDPTLSAIEGRSLEAGRRALISRLMTSFNLLSNEVTIVFDGSNAPLPAPAQERHGQVRVLYSRQGETADTVILRMLAAAPATRQILLLSDDRELRTAVERRGGLAGGAAERARPRPSPNTEAGKDDEARPRSTEKKGNPRRAKKRSRRTPIVGW